MRARLVVRPKAGTVPANDRLRAPTGQCGPRHASDDIVMQLAISFAGILLMMGVAGILTWYKANNALHSDAATVEPTIINFVTGAGSASPPTIPGPEVASS